MIAEEKVIKYKGNCNGERFIKVSMSRNNQR